MEGKIIILVMTMVVQVQLMSRKSKSSVIGETGGFKPFMAILAMLYNDSVGT